MHAASSLAILFTLALTLSAPLARADQPVPAPPEDRSDDAASVGQPGGPQGETEAEDPTWFGMGFESREARFRRDMGVPIGPGAANGGAPGGGAGHGGRH